MLNIGVIGNTEVLEPFVKRIRKNKNVNVIGKASVGRSVRLQSFHFSIPEFNRVELVERADILLVDNSSLLPFDLLCNIVRKGKHIFAAEYLTLTEEQCSKLVKLADESGSVIQFTNPIFYMPGVTWLKNQKIFPMYMNITWHFGADNLSNMFHPLFMMLSGITGLNPKRTGVTSFRSEEGEKVFTNLRLEFPDVTAVNLNFGSRLPEGENRIEIFAHETEILLDFTNSKYLKNGEPVQLVENDEEEFDIFINSVLNKKPAAGHIGDYQSAVRLETLIDDKITRFFT